MQRRNQSLLETYSSVADIETRRDRALEGVDQGSSSVPRPGRPSCSRSVSPNREAEFYARRPMPSPLAAALRESDSGWPPRGR